MLHKLLLVASAALVLANCAGSEEPAEQAPMEEPAEVQTQEDIDPEAYHNNIQAAMGEIPSSIRTDFQKLFTCEVRRNNERDNPKPVNAEYIRALTEYLKTNPAAAAQSCAS